MVKENAFSLLTTAPGPDLAPYHDRQIVLLPPAAGLDWLTLSRPQGELLQAPPAGALKVATIRKDGLETGSQPLRRTVDGLCKFGSLPERLLSAPRRSGALEGM